MASNHNPHEISNAENDAKLFPETGQGDQVLLESMGYSAELSRTRTTLQVAFMAFVLGSIPFGLTTNFYQPLVGGGPANIIWGWVGVSFIVLCVAASLGEITSVCPTAGGVYHQTFVLSTAKWRRPASWTCGWLYVVGNITITLSVNFLATLFIISCLNIFETSPGVGIFPNEPYQVYLIFLGITILCNVVSSMGNRWLPILDMVAMLWTLVGVTAFIVCILVIAKDGRNDVEHVFTEFKPLSGWPAGWSFCIGLLQAAYGTSSTGMIISMCEEVLEPWIQVPKAMVATVGINFCAGLFILIPLVFVLPDATTLTGNTQPVPTIVKEATGSSGGAFALLIPLMVLGLLCGICCTTATSRAVWAFARDGAIPGSSLWKQVNNSKINGVPFNAMMMSMTVQLLLGLIYFGSSAAFNAFSNVGVVCLTASYAVPIAVSLAEGRTKVKAGEFYLGQLGIFCNVMALSWSLLTIPLFCMPATIPVDKDSMNYASVVFVASILIAIGWYIVWGYKNYVGPLHSI
ncbi:uncharacterized protein K452DRAFT_270551 [Aplosporella prunicola CBS 121167]|uniref:Amino acid permease n=1 Tax=Aplosporella prunicola CBS 121167 TaxID=1176127 RepID=A0A6A6BF26_9PEZI|nr:uncharacterized protein K452DRAFT_270551 [Aplosporella prunicola CBS 121167]KAF2141915.1 hypothetical protein K452DRAFT_270551 [Aplosporella prunicola CBS 121167]